MPGYSTADESDNNYYLLLLLVILTRDSRVSSCEKNFTALVAAWRPGVCLILLCRRALISRFGSNSFGLCLSRVKTRTHTRRRMNTTYNNVRVCVCVNDSDWSGGWSRDGQTGVERTRRLGRRENYTCVWNVRRFSECYCGWYNSHTRVCTTFPGKPFSSSSSHSSYFLMTSAEVQHRRRTYHITTDSGRKTIHRR